MRRPKGETLNIRADQLQVGDWFIPAENRTVQGAVRIRVIDRLTSSQQIPTGEFIKASQLRKGMKLFHSDATCTVLEVRKESLWPNDPFDFKKRNVLIVTCSDHPKLQSFTTVVDPKAEVCIRFRGYRQETDDNGSIHLQCDSPSVGRIAVCQQANWIVQKVTARNVFSWDEFQTEEKPRMNFWDQFAESITQATEEDVLSWLDGFDVDDCSDNLERTLPLKKVSRHQEKTCTCETRGQRFGKGKLDDCCPIHGKASFKNTRRTRQEPQGEASSDFWQEFSPTPKKMTQRGSRKTQQTPHNRAEMFRKHLR